MKPAHRLTALLCAILTMKTFAQTDTFEAAVRRRAAPAMDELAALLRLPNNVENSGQIQRNAAELAQRFRARGFATEFWPTRRERPFVYAERRQPGARATLLFIGHYDGVPVAGESWHSDPYVPVLRDPTRIAVGDWTPLPWPADGQFADHWRLFARSAADSKNAIVALLQALDTLQSLGLEPAVNLKVLLDGDEERESPCLDDALAEHGTKLSADLLISISGEVHQSGRPTVDFGLRGILLFSLTTHTATSDLHSGHFGNFAPNAALQLARLVSTFKGAHGRVLVDGFYDQVLPLGPAERAALDTVPRIERELQQRFGIAQPEIAGASLQELINQPTFNLRGFAGGHVGSAGRNAIPATATAEFDLRLVKGMDPDATLAAIRRHVERQGWRVLDRAPTREELLAGPPVVELRQLAGFGASRTPLDSPAAATLLRCVRRAVREDLIINVTNGGSLAFDRFERLGLPVTELPLSNFDCNQHTAHENLELSYFFQGIGILTSVLRWDAPPKTPNANHTSP